MSSVALGRESRSKLRTMTTKTTAAAAQMAIRQATRHRPRSGIDDLEVAVDVTELTLSIVMRWGCFARAGIP